MITLRGENLVFLISQPSSGSTLFQQILMNHQEIFSMPEPWIMLAPLTLFKNNINSATYNKNIEKETLEQFYSQISDKKLEVYYESLRLSHQYLYNKALEKTNKKIFLDKTPRYYLIIDELQKVFPEAKFIILLRNPIAVMLSVYTILGRKKWNTHSVENRIDFVTAIDNFVSLKSKETKNVFFVQYEKILTDFNNQLNNTLNFLNLDLQDDMDNYSVDPNFKWGDQSGNISKQNTIKYRAENDWVNKIKNTEQLKLIKDYVKFLGRENLELLGYSYEAIVNDITQYKRSKLKRILNSVSFKYSVLGKKRTLKRMCDKLNKLLAL